MSDVPLGMFLSGGIDSSAIAALMARMIDRPLQTFSVAFKDRAFNDLGYAREVAQAIGAVSHEIVIDDNDFFGALPRLVWHEDEPIAHTSSVPLYFVSALAKQHVTVVLTGEGSDELLAGYGKYPRVAWNWRAGDAAFWLVRITDGPDGVRVRLWPDRPGT
jgi:asparagine synthase (glutamine-hydrolysing)